MEKIKATFKNALPYQKDAMNLPGKDLETSIPFYETIMDFKLVSRKDLRGTRWTLLLPGRTKKLILTFR